MEVCVDSLESALNAFEGKAARIELCSSLGEGGLTPTYGLYKSIQKHLEKIDIERNFKINCMIRCRPGDFNYSDTEIETMFEDAKKFVELGVDGLVFGALDPRGNVDETLARDFLMLIPKDIKTTFHRAFDVCCNWRTAYGQLESLGFNKLLTSGQKKTALEGRSVIRELVEMSQRSEQAVKIIAGCGINALNLEAILKETKCEEFHASCRTLKNSKMLFKNDEISMGSNAIDEYSISFASKEKVKELVDIFNKFNSHHI